MEQQNMPPEPQTGDAPQADAPVRGSVGALLKASRSRLGIELPAIAETLRIRLVYLEAIEAGRYEDLPGGTYAVGFIRSYGDQLGLDGMELVRRFKLETGVASPAEAQTISFPKPVKTLGLPVGAIATGVVVAGALLLGGWLLFSSNDRASLIPKIPAALNEKVGAPEAAAPPPAVKPAEEAKPAPVVEAEPPKPEMAKPAKPEPPKSIEAAKPEPPKPTEPAKPAKPEAVKVEPPKPAVEAPKPAEAAKPVAKVEAPKPAAKVEAPKPAAEEAEGLPEGPETVVRGPRIYGQENDNARIEIVASGDSWVQITENGNLVLTRLLHPGDRFKVPNRGGLLLMTGNAGGLDVLVDGQKAAPIGAAGQVMRDVPLDVERLRSARKTSN